MQRQEVRFADEELVSSVSTADSAENVIPSEMADEHTPLLISSGKVSINDPSISESTRFGQGSTRAASPEIIDPLRDVPSWKRWMSICVLYYTMVTVMLTFSIVITSLFPYLQQLTGGRASTTFLGIVVAGYSLGQLVTSPVLGIWSDRRPTREPLLVSLIVCVVANVGYCYASALSSQGEYVVLAARVLVGASAGCAAVVRSYIAVATTQQERIKAMAGVSGSQTIGFTLGPLLALIFVPLKSSGLYFPAMRFHFNMYTGPGYLSALLAIINIILVVVVFKDYRLIHMSKPNSPSRESVTSPSKMKRFEASRSASSTMSTVEPIPPTPVKKIPAVDRIATVVAIFLFFVILFMFAVFETITVPYTMDEFGWDRQRAMFYNNLLFGVLSIISIVTIVVIGYIGKLIEERIMMMFGFIVMSIAYFLLIPLSDSFPTVAISLINPSNHTFPVFHNNSIPYPVSNATIPIGCRYPDLKWCIDVPQLLFPKYIASMSILGLGYNCAIIPCFTIFSKILGPFPQGTMMGIITAMGSLARTVGPLFVTFLYDQLGPQITFATADGIIALAIIILMVFCYRMVPYGQKRQY